MIECPHWSDMGVDGRGRCALKRFGGAPSHSVCKMCLRGTIRESPAQPRHVVPNKMLQLQRVTKRRRPHTSENVDKFQAGDLLNSIIASCGFKPVEGCKCKSMRLKMNKWGFKGCWHNRDEIVDWLVLRAHEVGVVVPQATVRHLVYAALKEYIKHKLLDTHSK